MNIKNSVSVLLLLTSLNILSQDLQLTTLLIPKELKENANAVVRSNDIVIELHDYSRMTIKTKRVITVFNENGLGHLDSYVFYDSDIKVKSVSAKIYNALGSEVKKFKRKDFEDYSASGSNLFSDNRVLDLDYTPTEYPFTFLFEVETDWSSTAFFPRWMPLESYYISTENASYKIINQQSVPLDVKEFRLNIDGIEEFSQGNIVHYKAKNLKAYKREAMSPSLSKVVPFLMVAPQKFKLVNVDGHAENWNDFGKWMYDVLLKNRNELPAETIAEISNLVKDIENPIEKAKKIYQYVQDKTRYISIQLGVGGWQPMLASKVDEVSYGDCKALTNYTMSLLQSQGITAYYTVVYGDRDLVEIESESVGMQGNHVILNVPDGDESVWLECTSQKVPFGHIANFTDDRDVLVITPEGGKIEHTRSYSSQESYLKSEASISIDKNGGFKADILTKSGGIQYDDRLRQVVTSDQKDRDVHYKKYWSYINDLYLTKLNIENDRDAIEITEKISVEAPSYAIKAGEKFLIAPNFFNRFRSLPPRYSDRKLPFVVQRGFYDEDIYEINLPEGYVLESIPENEEIETKFGVYKMTLEKLEDAKIRYSRSFELFKGDYEKEEYNTYRSFLRKIAKADKAPFVLNKIN